MPEATAELLQSDAIHYEDVLDSDRWRYIGSLLRSWHEGCQACGNEYGLQAHHAHYDTLGQEQPRDLVLLCDDCHASVHAYRWPHEEIDELREQNPRHWRELERMTIT